MPFKCRCPIKISTRIRYIYFNDVPTSSDNAYFKLVEIVENDLPDNTIQLLLYQVSY